MIAVIVLQYGGWRYTASCLQSLVPAVDAGAVRVIVVDNASPDQSVAHLRAWINGGLSDRTPRPVHDSVSAYWWPLCGAAEQWMEPASAGDLTHAPWTLLLSTENRGFAAGMNAGIRVALSDSAISAVWLLNNDTVVSPDAVTSVSQALATHSPSIGQFGMTICYYDRPSIVQSIGWCRWNSWLATAHRIHDGASLAQPLARETRRPGYVYGASWVIRSAALRSVGLLSEESFLYGEELDWACRASDRWGTELIPNAIVWHREGASAGAAHARTTDRSELVDLCGIWARLRLTRRFFPSRLPFVYSSLIGAALNRLRRGDPRRALAVLRLVVGRESPAPRPTPIPEFHASPLS